MEGEAERLTKAQGRRAVSPAQRDPAPKARGRPQKKDLTKILKITQKTVPKLKFPELGLILAASLGQNAYLVLRSY